MNLVNVNHHIVTIRNSSGKVVRLPSAKPAIRLQSVRREEVLDTPQGGILLISYADELLELPEPVEGTLYVGNEQTARQAKLQGREDFVYAVTTGKGDGRHLPVRDENGRLAYVCALRRP